MKKRGNLLKPKKTCRLPAKKRKAALTAAILSAAVCVSALTAFGIIGVKTDRTVVKSTCRTVSEIDYQPVFRDDPLYNETNLEFGDGYVMKYVDALDMDFHYDFDCPGAADISGTYSVTAQIAAAYNNADLIWTKTYPLVPEKSFSSEKPSGIGCRLPLKDYEELAKRVEMETGVSTSAVVTVTYTVNASAAVGGTPVTDSSAATLTFDLSQDVLIIGGTPRTEQASDVTETVSQPLVSRKAALAAGIPLSVLALCAAVFLLVFTRGVPEDPVRLQLRGLYRRYGGRIVELRPGTAVCGPGAITVGSFRDLLLTADELKKPIFKQSSGDETDVVFFVADGGDAYLFDPGAAYGRQPGKRGR
jgi:hypothetical protein